MNNIYIAGASSRARTTKAYLEFLYPDTKVQAFLVSPEMDDNPTVQDGIPVIAIRERNKNSSLDESSVESGFIDTRCIIYLGTRGANHQKLISELQEAGFQKDKIIPVSVNLDTNLRNEYVAKRYQLSGRKFIKIDRLISDGQGKIAQIGTSGNSYDKKKNACIYQIRSVFDSKITDSYASLEEERYLQVGASLTDKRISCDILADNTGDNISDRNRQFCELTGLYWIWKNTTEDIVGLVHYRRHFLLPKEWVNVFVGAGVDAILPVPLCVVPSLEENYKSRHLGFIWDKLFDIMSKYHPEDAKEARHFFKENNLYSPCNMIITKKHILDEYCEWLFPMLLELTDEIGTIDDQYQNRYPGFLSERLLTYYFESKCRNLNIVYADKNFLQ